MLHMPPFYPFPISCEQKSLGAALAAAHIPESSAALAGNAACAMIRHTPLAFCAAAAAVSAAIAALVQPQAEADNAKEATHPVLREG